jgi:phosphatidylserine/phosphatidylglycerophosphate/cardiolipin synthase-like enzyme
MSAGPPRARVVPMPIEEGELGEVPAKTYVLRSALLSGDPTLAQVAAGRLRLGAPGTQPYPVAVLSSGQPVALVQLALIGLDWLDPMLGGHGRFDTPTGEAVVRYKKAHRLSPSDPVVGPETIRALDLDLLALAPKPPAGRPPPGAGGFPAPPARRPPQEDDWLRELERRFFPTGGKDAAPFSRAGSVQRLVDGSEFFPAVHAQVLELLRRGGPADAWYMTAWTLQHDFVMGGRGGLMLVDLLDRVAQRGVDVRVIVWASDALLRLDSLWPESLRKWVLSRVGEFQRIVQDNVRSVDTLRARGSLRQRALLDWSGNLAGSHHSKLNVFVRGGAITAFVSGLDPQDARFDDRRHGRPFAWHDAAVVLTGEAAARVHETFATRWFECRTLSTRTFSLPAGSAPRPYNPKVTLPDPPARTATGPLSSSTSVSVVRSVPDSKEFRYTPPNRRWDRWPRGGVHEVKRTLQRALGEARRFVYIEDQGFDAEDYLFPLLRKACERGVKVVAVLPGQSDAEGRPVVNQDLSKAVQGLVAKIAPASRTNLAVWSLDGVFVHAKVVVVDDDFSLVGSANFMDRSMDWSGTFNWKGDDSETSAAVVGPTFVAALRTDLWAEHLGVRGSRSAERDIYLLDPVMGFWRKGWGGEPTWPHSTRLRFVGPLKGERGRPLLPGPTIARATGPPSAFGSRTTRALGRVVGPPSPGAIPRPPARLQLPG